MAIPTLVEDRFERPDEAAERHQAQGEARRRNDALALMELQPYTAWVGVVLTQWGAMEAARLKVRDRSPDTILSMLDDGRLALNEEPRTWFEQLRFYLVPSARSVAFFEALGFDGHHAVELVRYALVEHFAKGGERDKARAFGRSRNVYRDKRPQAYKVIATAIRHFLDKRPVEIAATLGTERSLKSLPLDEVDLEALRWARQRRMMDGRISADRIAVRERIGHVRSIYGKNHGGPRSPQPPADSTTARYTARSHLQFIVAGLERATLPI